MEEDRDYDSDDEIEYCGMIQPPLIKQLRTILSEYPDDGQILKVYRNNIIQVDKHCMDWLIDWIEFYAVSAIFQPCNGGDY